MGEPIVGARVFPAERRKRGRRGERGEVKVRSYRGLGEEIARKKKREIGEVKRRKGLSAAARGFNSSNQKRQ